MKTTDLVVGQKYKLVVPDENFRYFAEDYGNGEEDDVAGAIRNQICEFIGEENGTFVCKFEGFSEFLFNEEEVGYLQEVKEPFYISPSTKGY